MLDTTIKVKTDSFDGPLSLLLMLVEKEQMSIADLNLTKITKQYLDYLNNMRELNFDVAGDYLFLAATLVLLKSKNCVTEEDADKLKAELGGEDSLKITSHAELVRRLEQLKHYQKMGLKLMELPQHGKDIFTKPKVNRKEIIDSILTPMDIEKLTNTMIDFIFRENRKYTVVKRDRLSIKEKLQFLKSYLEQGQKTNFEELLEKDTTTKNNEKAESHSIDNVVITFISLLELARLKRIEIFQNEETSNIYVEVVKSLADFDVEQADGFEDENEQSANKDIDDNTETASQLH